MSFTEKLKRRKGCRCWDCLRRDGLTPPMNRLHKHKPLDGKIPKFYKGGYG